MNIFLKYFNNNYLSHPIFTILRKKMISKQSNQNLFKDQIIFIPFLYYFNKRYN